MPDAEPLAPDPEVGTGINSPQSIFMLKILSIFLGLVLIGGSVLMAVLVATGAHKKDRRAAAPAAVAAPAATPDVHAIPLGAEERLVDFRTDGRLLTVRIAGPEGERLVVYEAATGRVLSEYRTQ